MKFRRFLLSQTREDQIRVYKLIRSYLQSGKKFIFGMPLELAKYAFRYLKFH